MRYYFDSNVIISLIKSEIGKGFRLMYPAVETLLKKMQREKDVALISELFIQEIFESVHLNEDEVLEHFKGVIVEKISPNKETKSLAHEINKNYGIHLFPTVTILPLQNYRTQIR